MGKESSLQDMDDYGNVSSETEDIDVDYYGGYGLDLMTFFWNLEDYPIPESAELDSIRPRIMKALALMGFGGHTEIEGYADHLKYDVDELWNAGICCCSLSMLAAYMPMSMILHAQSRRPLRERVTLFVIANQIPGTELHRVQQCLKSRDYKVIVVDDPSKQALFQSAESLVDCTRFLGAPQPVSRSGRAFFSGEKPISTRRFAELQDELKQVLLGGGYSAGYASYVFSLCRTIAMDQELILEDIIGRVRHICPIDDDLCRIIDKVLCERGFRLNFFPEQDNAKQSPFHCVESPSLVVERGFLAATCDSHSDPISKFDFPKIEDFSEPITPVDTVVFWDVVDCPFPLCSDPDEIYRRLDKALCERGFRGEMTIWAYVDENNGTWTGEYLRNKTWDSRIYFLLGGDKASRLRRMLNDTLLWKMDMLSAVDNAYTADVIVVSDQVREDAEFFSILEYMRLNRFNSFLVTPIQHVNKPESLEWPRLLLDEAVCIGSTCESSECSPKRHKADDAAE